MKPMILLLRSAVVLNLLIGFVNSDWSIMTNNWSASLFMLLLLLLLIEEGLHYYRDRVADVEIFLAHQRRQANNHEDRLMSSNHTRQE